jgi:hypothetical protein
MVMLISQDANHKDGLASAAKQLYPRALVA